MTPPSQIFSSVQKDFESMLQLNQMHTTNCWHDSYRLNFWMKKELLDFEANFSFPTGTSRNQLIFLNGLSLLCVEYFMPKLLYISSELLYKLFLIFLEETLPSFSFLFLFF